MPKFACLPSDKGGFQIARFNELSKQYETLKIKSLPYSDEERVEEIVRILNGEWGTEVSTIDYLSNNLVDMGLSVKWATCNVGAFKPEEYGSDLTFSELSALNIPGMRVPTDDDLTELRDKCSWEWTALNGVSGMKVTSPLTGNSIFLPAAGYRYSNGSMCYVGSCGMYWSSTPSPHQTIFFQDDDDKYAWSIGFASSEIYQDHQRRFNGLSVRLISE